MTDTELFEIIWHSMTIISIRCWNSKFMYLANDDLKCTMNDWRDPSTHFEIFPKAVCPISYTFFFFLCFKTKQNKTIKKSTISNIKYKQ